MKGESIIRLKMVTTRRGKAPTVAAFIVYSEQVPEIMEGLSGCSPLDCDTCIN
jgi:hypothetical protein